MTGWTEQDSTLYRAIAAVAVPRRTEMIQALVSAAPFDRDAAIRIVELGAGEGLLAEALLDRFPAASMLALDGSESMRDAAAARLARFGDRATVRAFTLETLDWWELLFGADLVVSSLALHHLNDAKKQYVFKAIADRLSERGALLIADLVAPADTAIRQLAAEQWDRAAEAQAEALGNPALYARFLEAKWNHCRFPDPSDHPSMLFHQLVWLKHAGFTAVDCVWMFAGHAVFGGFKQLPRPAVM